MADIRLTAGKSARLRFSVNSALEAGDTLVFEIPLGASVLTKTTANAGEIEITETSATSTGGYIYIDKGDIPPTTNRDTQWELEFRTASGKEFSVAGGGVAIRQGVGT